MIIDKNFLFRHLGGILYLFEDKKVRQNWANKPVYFLFGIDEYGRYTPQI